MQFIGVTNLLNHGFTVQVDVLRLKGSISDN